MNLNKNKSLSSLNSPPLNSTYPLDFQKSLKKGLLFYDTSGETELSFIPHGNFSHPIQLFLIGCLYEETDEWSKFFTLKEFIEHVVQDKRRWLSTIDYVFTNAPFDWSEHRGIKDFRNPYFLTNFLLNDDHAKKFCPNLRKIICLEAFQKIMHYQKNFNTNQESTKNFANDIGYTFSLKFPLNPEDTFCILKVALEREGLSPHMGPDLLNPNNKDGYFYYSYNRHFHQVPKVTPLPPDVWLYSDDNKILNEWFSKPNEKMDRSNRKYGTVTQWKSNEAVKGANAISDKNYRNQLSKSSFFFEQVRTQTTEERTESKSPYGSICNRKENQTIRCTETEKRTESNELYGSIRNRREF